MKTRFFSLALAFFIVFPVSANNIESPVKMAIVLDDIGNSQYDLQALNLPPEITFAILPYTPHAKKIAKLASRQNRELLLHMPMQAKSKNKQLGKGALLLNMQEQEFKDTLNNALNYLPDATGISNHMGSALTEHVKSMQWTMDTLHQHALYFLDSRTTAQTIAEYRAKMSAIPALRRHVFLDNITSKEAMEKQLSHAIEIGRKRSAVIIIAHPYPTTIQFLNEKFNQQPTEVQLVALQTLLSDSERFALAKKRSQLQQVNSTKF